MITRSRAGLALLGVSIALVACSGGGGGGGSGGGGGGGTTQTGDTSFSVTDASSDQIETFTVDVTDISLTRPNGAVLHTLAASQRVDFADLVNESQLLTAYGALAGTYTSVSMTLDFSNANVILAGQTAPATIKDHDGNVVSGPLTLPIQLPNGKPLVVTPGAHRLVSLDFDLDGSCAIDMATNTVQLGTVIKAEAHPNAPKPHNVYGTLAAVDSAASSITVTLNGPAALVPGPSFTINTTASTIFFVNGQPALGAAGFALVAGQPLKSAVLAQGAIDLANRSMTAKSVEAWIQKDVVHGHVVGRDAAGNITVKGLSVDFANGGTSLSATALLNQTITVNATAAKVYQRFSGQALGHDAIGVGARIYARGTFDQGSMTLDCGQGHVFLPETGIFGFLNQPASGGTLSMTVARFGRRPVAGFDFTVGTTVTADPNNYVVSTSSLNVGAIASGAPVVIRGLVSPWNASPPGSTGADNAKAITVIDRSAFALLYADWLVAKTTNVTATTTELTVDTTGSIRHFVDPGFVAPVTLTGTVKIVPGTNLSYFAIMQSGGITLSTDFASFEADLAARLAAGGRTKAIAAIGGWNDSSTTLTASRIAIFLK